MPKIKKQILIYFLTKTHKHQKGVTNSMIPNHGNNQAKKTDNLYMFSHCSL